MKEKTFINAYRKVIATQTRRNRDTYGAVTRHIWGGNTTHMGRQYDTYDSIKKICTKSKDDLMQITSRLRLNHRAIK